MSGAAWPEASLFPLAAPSIESSNPIVSFLRYDVWFSGRRIYEVARRTMQKLSKQTAEWARQKQKERRHLVSFSGKKVFVRVFERLRGAVESLRRG
jgi:hypothetical protein